MKIAHLCFLHFENVTFSSLEKVENQKENLMVSKSEFM